MSERKAKDKRVFYNNEEKERILKKTGGRCAHCGVKLNINTMEKDHAISLSKGGMSDLSNIVPLCSKCNSNKINYVVNPEDYFKFIKKPYMRELKAEFEKYISSVGYFDVDTFFPTDIISFDYQYQVATRNNIQKVKKRAVFQKAIYSDLDEVYWFLKKYFQKYNGEDFDYTDPTVLREKISQWFMLGTILTNRDSSGTLEEVVVFLHQPYNSYEAEDYESAGFSEFANGKVLCSIRTLVLVFFNTNLILDRDGKDVSFLRALPQISWYYGITIQLMREYLKVLGWGIGKPLMNVLMGCGHGDERIDMLISIYVNSRDVLEMSTNARKFVPGLHFYLFPSGDMFSLLNTETFVRTEVDFCRVVVRRLEESRKYIPLLKNTINCPVSKLMFVSELSDPEIKILADDVASSFEQFQKRKKDLMN